MTKKTKELLNFLFVESQDRQNDETTAEDVTMLFEDAFNLEQYEEKLPELKKLLDKVGVKDYASRIEVVPCGFKLVAKDAKQHADDAAILLDMEKIHPMVSAGYASVRTEPDIKDGKELYAITIICDVDNAKAQAPGEQDDDLSNIEKVISASYDELVKSSNKILDDESAEDLVKRKLKKDKK